MKRFLLLFLSLFLLSHTAVYAKDYTIQRTSNDTIKISTTSGTAVITYIHTGNGAAQDTVSLWEKKEANGSLSGKLFSKDYNFLPNHPETKTDTITGLTPKTTYYLGINNTPIETEDITIDTTTSVAADPLKFTANNGTVTVLGKIDNIKYPNPASYYVQLEYSSQDQFTTDITKKPEGTLVTNRISISADGTYTWTLSNIDPTAYWYRESFYTGTGTLIGTPVVSKFNGQTGFSPTTASEEQDDFESRSYRLLAPLPGLSVLLDPDLCREKKIENPGQGQICDVNDFLNFVLKIMIGLAAVVLVIRLMIEGFKIATSDVPFIKVEAKSKFWQALGGLVLALTAWLILNTINPRLVENDILINSVNLNIDSFDIGGALGGQFGTWKPIKINFNTQAYPAAKKAKEKTGVEASLILAIFDQETKSGSRGTGDCTINNTRVHDADKIALGTIATELRIDKNTAPISCAFKKDGVYQGYGGAIGYAQALPTTWNSYKDEVKTNLGKTTAANPWEVEDALMFIAVFMKHNGGISSPYEGACKYFGKCIFGGVDYAGQVMSRKASFEKEIEKRKNKGEIQ